MLSEAYGDKILSRACVFEWHKRFLGGRDSVEDDEPAGYPSFLIDECGITEFFCGYIVNFAKHVRFTSSDMTLVEKKAISSSSLAEIILNVVVDRLETSIRFVVHSWLEKYANLQSPMTPKCISGKVPYRFVTRLGFQTSGWSGFKPNRTVSCMVLKAADNDRRKKIALCHDEFRGSRSDMALEAAVE
ncbi:hypothetical protein TNCV_2616061 [Trichonephila clavipes]|nr:hypothetical protein TNCV_2616061 [Trichonephila clavipes]